MMLRISGCWRKIFLLPTVNKLWSSYCKILARRTSLWINPFVIHTLVVSIWKILLLFALSWFGVLLIPDVIFFPFFVWKILLIFMLLLYPFCSNVAASAYIPGQPSNPGIYIFFLFVTLSFAFGFKVPTLILFLKAWVNCFCLTGPVSTHTFKHIPKVRSLTCKCCIYHCTWLLV